MPSTEFYPFPFTISMLLPYHPPYEISLKDSSTHHSLFPRFVLPWIFFGCHHKPPHNIGIPCYWYLMGKFSYLYGTKSLFGRSIITWIKIFIARLVKTKPCHVEFWAWVMWHQDSVEDHGQVQLGGYEAWWAVPIHSSFNIFIWWVYIKYILCVCNFCLRAV